MRISLIWYFLLSFSRKNRYVPPLTVYMLLIVLLYSQKPNPIAGSYGATAVLTLFIAGWFSYVFLESEDRVQEQITLLHTKQTSVYFLSKWGALAVMLTAMCAITTIYPILIGAFAGLVPIDIWLLSFIVHLEIALLASSVSLMLESRFVARNNIAIGMMVIIFSLSLSLNKLEQFLPDLLHPLTWLLPPVKRIIGVVTESGEYSFVQSTLLIGYALAYIAIILFIYVVRVNRTDFHRK